MRGARILVLGAGGAARGVIAPLLALSPSAVVIANRTVERARELARRFAPLGPVSASALDSIPGAFDLVLNATSTSTRGQPLYLAASALAPRAWVYDMAYGPAARPFLDKARAMGARTSDGLGMLVEQAAEAFRIWHGTRPRTAPGLARLRARP
jgi:shikimate dehydrogenase